MTPWRSMISWAKGWYFMFSVVVAFASKGADQSNSSSVSITTLSVGRFQPDKGIASQRGRVDFPALSRIEGLPDLIGETPHGLSDLRIGVVERREITAVGIGDRPGKFAGLEEASQHHDRRGDERITIPHRH